MSTPTVLTERSWLLQSRINPFPVAARLDLDGTTLSLHLIPLAADAVLGWVEKRLSTDGLAARLAAGEDVPVFVADRTACTISWPKAYAGSAVQITDPSGTEWLVALDYPSGGSISQTLSLLSGRKKGKVWRAALEA